jgi:hypothetical protein
MFVFLQKLQIGCFTGVWSFLLKHRYVKTLGSKSSQSIESCVFC